MARKLSLGLVFTLLLALAACGSASPPTTASTPSSASDAAPTEVAPAAENPLAAPSDADSDAPPLGAAPTPGSAARPGAFERPLQLADPPMQGDDIVAVQQRLLDLHFYMDAVDGFFGPNTATAVRNFQTLNGLTVDGIVGERTWAALFSETAVNGDALLGDPPLDAGAGDLPPDYGAGDPPLDDGAGLPAFERTLQLADPPMQGDDVAAVQQRLLDLDFDLRTVDGDVLAVDGIFGSATETAVILFQRLNYDLLNNKQPDGIVDQQTWAALFSAEAVSGEHMGENPPPDGVGENPLPSGTVVGDPAGFVAGSLMYLGTDGMTMRVRSLGGSDDREAFVLALAPDEQVDSIVADPTGRRLAVHTSQNRVQIYALSSYSGSLQATINDVFQAQWSPTGERFLVASTLSEPAAGQVFIYAADSGDGAEPLQMLLGWWASWLPSGDALLIDGFQQVTLATLSDGGERLIVAPATSDQLVVYPAPDSSAALYYASTPDELSPSGNGWQWWAAPLDGSQPGCAQTFYGCGSGPVSLTPPNGNLVDEVAFDPAAAALAYAENVHSHLCVSHEDVYLIPLRHLSALPGNVTPLSPPTAPLPEDHGRLTKGLSFLPDGESLLFSYQPYTCSDSASTLLTPTIYIWNTSTPAQLTTVGAGAFPVWLP